ncbi:MAG: hypothetical protein Q9207_002362 [Kuettlingeria erythrocarpa]
MPSTLRQCAGKKPKPPGKPTQYTPRKAIKTPAPTTYQPFALTLASRAEPALLYQGPSNTLYATGCYLVGLLCFSWAVHAGQTMYYHPPSIFNRFLKSLYFGMCGLAVGMAVLFAIRPYRVVRSIQAVPTTAGNGARTLHLQIESAPLFPGIRPRTVSVPAGSVKLSEPLNSDTSGGVPLRMLELRRKRAEKVKKLGEGSIFLLPFRQLGFHLWNGWQAIKGTFLTEPFIYLTAKGYYGTWKVGKNGTGAGWALDEGRAIDRILKTKLTA